MSKQIKFKKASIKSLSEISFPVIGGLTENDFRCIDELVKIASKEDLLGLAAPQISYYKNIFVIRSQLLDAGPLINGNSVIINPNVLYKSAITEYANEGCWSLEDKTYFVSRPKIIYVCFNTLTLGGLISRDSTALGLENLAARCFLHEFDHLKGVLISDLDSGDNTF